MKTYHLTLSVIAASLLLGTSSFASHQTLPSHAVSFTASQEGCYQAANACLIEVTPSSLDHGYRSYFIHQLCKGKANYLYTNLKTQLSERKFLGTTFCNGVVTVSNMELGFYSSTYGIKNANDGWLMYTKAINHLTKMNKLIQKSLDIANQATSDTLPIPARANLQTFLTQYLLADERIAETTRANGMPIFTTDQVIKVPIHHGAKTIDMPFADVTLRSCLGSNTLDLSVATTKEARDTVTLLTATMKKISDTLENIESKKSALKEAMQQDKVITSIDLTSNIFSIKQETTHT